MVTTTSIIEELGDSVAKVCQAFEALTKSEGQVIRDEVQVLVAVLGKVRPIIKYCDGEIAIYGHGENDPQDSREYWQYLRERGVEVINDHGWEKNSGNLADGCRYEGRDLILGRSGALYWLVWEGDASGYQSEGWRCEAEVTKVSVKEAIEKFGFLAIIEGLKKVFQKSLEKADERRASLQERLDLIGRITKEEIT